MTLCRNASFPEFAWSGRVSSMTNRSEATAPRDPERSHPSQGAVGHGSVTPGLALAFSAALLALGGQRLVPTVSPLLVSIVLGIVVTNVWPIPARFGPGMTVAGKRVLRLGIVLLGLQLAVRDILGLGWQMMLVVVAIVGLGIVGTVWIGVLLGVSPAQRLLIACGFSVCGAAAVAAVEGVTDADQEDVASAISLVVVFGTAMIGIVPTLLGFSDLTLVQQGMIAGGAIHEVAQVVAASGLIGTGALAAAIVIKLARVLMLAPVILVIGLIRRQRLTDKSAPRPPLVPLFVLGFVAAALVRTLVDLPPEMLAVAQSLQTLLLSAGMFALGCGVRASVLRHIWGRQAVLASLSTALVAVLATGGVLLAS